VIIGYGEMVREGERVPEWQGSVRADGIALAILSWFEAHPRVAVDARYLAGLLHPRGEAGHQSITTSLTHLCHYRPECVRVGHGVFVWDPTRSVSTQLARSREGLLGLRARVDEVIAEMAVLDEGLAYVAEVMAP
jgi:hypothetical protein